MIHFQVQDVGEHKVEEEDQAKVDDCITEHTLPTNQELQPQKDLGIPQTSHLLNVMQNRPQLRNTLKNAAEKTQSEGSSII